MHTLDRKAAVYAKSDRNKKETINIAAVITTPLINLLPVSITPAIR